MWHAATLVRLVVGYGPQAVMLAMLGLASGAADAQCVSEPDSYRDVEFRAAVPCTIRGGEVLSTLSLQRLLAERSARLIDVLPAPRRPEGLPADVIWSVPRRRSLPGSVWLPNTGFGVLPVEEENYLRDNLERLTGGDRARALVFFCLRDCWMSWNAARRAVEWGYGSVYWYPDGSDGWEEQGLALELVRPVPREAGQ